VNFLMNPGVPGMALGLYYLGGDPAQVCKRGADRRHSMRCACVRGSLLWAAFFLAPLGMARAHHEWRVLATPERPDQTSPGGGAPAAHSAYVIILMRGTFPLNAEGEIEPFSSLRWHRPSATGRGPYADGIDAVYFVAQENYPRRVPRDRLSRCVCAPTGLVMDSGRSRALPWRVRHRFASYENFWPRRR